MGESFSQPDQSIHEILTLLFIRALRACSTSIPKNFAAEQIEVLSGETWAMQHLLLHVASILVFAITAVPLSKEKWGSEMSLEFLRKEPDRVRVPLAHVDDNMKKSEKAKAA